MKTSTWTLRAALLLCAWAAAGPAGAVIYLQCPAPLLTYGVTTTPKGTCRDSAGRATPCFLDQKNPINSSDPGCRYPEAPDFYGTCKVLLDGVTGQPSGATTDSSVVCRSVTCGDGHVNMADGADTYIFGFHDSTNTPEAKLAGSGFWLNQTPGGARTADSCTPATPGGTVLSGNACTFSISGGPALSGACACNCGADATTLSCLPCPGTSPVATCQPDGTLTGAAEFSAPTIIAREGQKLYITLTNVGFRERPDLGDPHTIHFHGFPNAGSVFDGEPMASFGINMGTSFTYFYDNKFPGTYMWHCHVEAAEHMQMGMLGNLYILPAQDGTSIAYPRGSLQPYTTHTKFAYDDCPTGSDPMCGSTGYDVMYFLQETAFDPEFHRRDHTYMPVDFANMNDTYSMLNGRGYPDTVNPNILLNAANAPSQPTPGIPFTVDPATGARAPLAIKKGQKLLLHLSSLATEAFYTVTALGIPMRVVGQGAQLLRGPTGTNTSYATGSVTLSGGEGVDVLLDTTTVSPGTYFLYTTNFNHLSNDAEDFGGMMTEIVVSP
jgi:FtsP/CotA-like multicopper oxidase with cupredoxin domain